MAHDDLLTKPEADTSASIDRTLTPDWHPDKRPSICQRVVSFLRHGVRRLRDKTDATRPHVEPPPLAYKAAAVTSPAVTASETKPHNRRDATTSDVQLAAETDAGLAKRDHRDRHELSELIRQLENYKLSTDMETSVDLHMNFIDHRIRRELRIKRLSIHDEDLRELLEELREQIVDMIKRVWAMLGRQLFVHDFLFVEDGHTLDVLLPFDSDETRQAIYTHWRLIVSDFREEVYQQAIMLKIAQDDANDLSHLTSSHNISSSTNSSSTNSSSANSSGSLSWPSDVPEDISP